MNRLQKIKIIIIYSNLISFFKDYIYKCINDKYFFY